MPEVLPDPVSPEKKKCRLAFYAGNGCACISRCRLISLLRGRDLYLTLQVVLPPATGERARAAYRAFEKELHFNPRQALEA